MIGLWTSSAPWARACPSIAALWSAGTQARLAVPVLLLAVHVGTGLWAQQRAGRSRLAGLQRASGALAGPQELDAALPAFLDELLQAFECAGVELRLTEGVRGAPLRLTAGRDPGAAGRGSAAAGCGSPAADCDCRAARSAAISRSKSLNDSNDR